MKYLPLITGLIAMGTSSSPLSLLQRNDKTDTPTQPMERSKHTTIKPENKDQPASVNILRVVRDHAPATIDELEEAIRDLKVELAEKERELEYNMQLKAITDEFYS